MRVLVAALALAVWLPAGHAADPPAKPKTPAEQLAALKAEADKEEGVLKKDYRSAADDAARKKVIERYKALVKRIATACLELADKNPKDSAAMEALLWVLSNQAPGGTSPEVNRALDLLARDHSQGEELPHLLPALANIASPKVEALLRAVLEKNPKREAQAAACLTLAQYLKNQAGEPAHKADAERLTSEAEKYFALAVEKYGDVRIGRQSVADSAKGELFELQHLMVGKTAPEIEGKDADGKSFKLSDYKGKVVVLDFWARW